MAFPLEMGKSNIWRQVINILKVLTTWRIESAVWAFVTKIVAVFPFKITISRYLELAEI